MIENKELGLKIAVDKNEAYWQEMQKKCKDMIDNAKHEIELDEHILQLCEEKLKAYQGAEI